MASNDDAPPKPTPKEGPVAFLTRVIHEPAQPNAQTPLRVVCLLILAVTMSFAPQPAALIALICVVLLALSFGQVPAKR